MKAHAFIQRETIVKKRKYIEEIDYFSSVEPLSQFQQKLERSVLRWREISLK